MTRISLLASVAIVIPAISSTTAQAQASADDTVSDIIVTAQRREQSLQKVPVSVSVVSGQALSEKNITNLEQLSVQTPGVRIAQAPASDLLNVRGAGSGLNSGFEQSVATFVDGIYRGRARSSRAALFDLDRVEVLKGPQAIFFGNNAIAGAFNITTRKPGHEFRYNALALASPSDGEYALEGGVDLPLTPDVAVRLSTRASGMNGYIFNRKSNRHEPRLRDWIGRVNAVWQASDAITSNLRVDVIHNRDVGTYSTELLNCPPPPGFGGPRGQCAAYLAASGGAVDDKLNYKSATGNSLFNYSAVEVGFNNDVSLGDHTLTLGTGYFHHNVGNLAQIIPTPLPGLFGVPSPISSKINEQISQFSQEIRLSSPADNKLSYMLGAYFLASDLDAESRVGSNVAPFGNIVGNGFPPNTPLTILIGSRQRERSFSVFGSTTLQITDYLRLSGGLRFSHVNKRGTANTQFGTSSNEPDFSNFIGAPLAAQSALSTFLGIPISDYPLKRRVDTALLPSVNLQYDITPEAMAYASFSTGFKAGGFSGTSNDVFDPERVKAYEAGIKSRFFDRALTLNLTIFRNDYRNLQETSQVVTGNLAISVVGNSAASRSQGVEANVILKVSPRLSLYSDVSYLDAKYTRYPNAPCGTLGTFLSSNCTQDMSGARRPWAPEWSGNVGISYKVPIGDATVSVDPLVYFSSDYLQNSNNDPARSQSSYTKFDLRLAIGDQNNGWELAVIGKNLSNKATASFRNSFPTSPGSLLALPERARSVAIQFTIKN